MLEILNKNQRFISIFHAIFCDFSDLHYINKQNTKYIKIQKDLFYFTIYCIFYFFLLRIMILIISQISQNCKDIYDNLVNVYIDLGRVIGDTRSWHRTFHLLYWSYLTFDASFLWRCLYFIIFTLLSNETSCLEVSRVIHQTNYRTC